MKAPSAISGLYAIIDSAYVGPGGAGACARALLRGGARMIQLRAKGADAKCVLEAAMAVREATSGKALFIVNDRLDIALISGADGVHIGQDDIPLKDARRLLPEAVIGVSTHNTEEAMEAEAAGADYISFGPVFRTGTKKDAQAPKGLVALAETASRVKVPVVAIGGITLEAAAGVIAAGASAIAVISGILESEDVAARTASFVEMLRR